MNTNYKEIDFNYGARLEECINELLQYKEKGILVYGTFNIHKFYSDTVTMDNAYIKVHGVTKAEFDKRQQEWMEESQKQNQDYINNIPELSQYWMGKGKKILDKSKWKLWDEAVAFSLNNLYQGNDLKQCLDIVELLNNSEPLEKAKELVYNQCHSGISFRLVCSMVKEFSPRGHELVSFIGK